MNRYDRERLDNEKFFNRQVSIWNAALESIGFVICCASIFAIAFI